MSDKGSRTNSRSKRDRGAAPTHGLGGELHQHGDEPLTTNHGVPSADNQNSLRLGDRGPTLLEDFALRRRGSRTCSAR